MVVKERRMIKVMLKEPVTSGYDQQKQLVDKMGNFLLVQGTLDNQFAEKLLSVKWFKGINNSGNSVLIPLDNIAYIEEVSAADVGR
jgi:hypothetical protein